MKETVTPDVKEEASSLTIDNTPKANEAAVQTKSNAQSVQFEGDEAQTAETTDIAYINCDKQSEDTPKQAEDTPKKTKKELPAWIKKIVDYLKAHEDIRQMVFFLLFSVICGASQMIVTYALSAGFKLEAHLGSTRLDWFVFHYATQAEFIGFLVGSVVGQVLTFVLNRKKTFNVPDYVALRAVLYAIMAALIIIMQTYLGGLVTDACWSAKPDANGFLDLVFNLTGQAVAGIAAVIVNFLGNKFFVMRDWGKKKRLAAEQAAAQQNEAIAESGETDNDLMAQAASDNIEE